MRTVSTRGQIAAASCFCYVCSLGQFCKVGISIHKEDMIYKSVGTSGHDVTKWYVPARNEMNGGLDLQSKIHKTLFHRRVHTRSDVTSAPRSYAVAFSSCTSSDSSLGSSQAKDILSSSCRYFPRCARTHYALTCPIFFSLARFWRLPLFDLA